MARWVDFSSTGAHLAWRVKNGNSSLPAKTIEALPDGSTLVRLRKSNRMLASRRRKAGDPAPARLPDTIARLVEFDVLVTDAAVKTKASRFRILTTLLDWQACPAGQIAAVYAERWQVEVAYYRIKVTLRGRRRPVWAHEVELREHRDHVDAVGDAADRGCPDGDIRP